jgi:hypothetical protein
MNIKKTCLLIAAVWAAAIVSPVLADAATRHGHVRQQVTHQRTINPNAGHAAFGMYTAPSGRFDPNSPTATGGGSLGYNRKLLIY